MIWAFWLISVTLAFGLGFAIGMFHEQDSRPEGKRGRR